jgi:hypothetical protein
LPVKDAANPVLCSTYWLPITRTPAEPRVLDASGGAAPPARPLFCDGYPQQSLLQNGVQLNLAASRSTRVAGFAVLQAGDGTVHSWSCPPFWAPSERCGATNDYCDDKQPQPLLSSGGSLMSFVRRRPLVCSSAVVLCILLGVES